MTVEQLIQRLDEMRRRGFANSKVIVNLGKNESANSKELQSVDTDTVYRYKYTDIDSISDYYDSCADVFFGNEDYTDPEVVVTVAT